MSDSRPELVQDVPHRHSILHSQALKNKPDPGLNILLKPQISIGRLLIKPIQTYILVHHFAERLAHFVKQDFPYFNRNISIYSTSQQSPQYYIKYILCCFSIVETITDLLELSLLRHSCSKKFLWRLNLIYKTLVLFSCKI